MLIPKKIQLAAIVSTVLLFGNHALALSAACHIYLGENQHTAPIFEFTSVPPNEASPKLLRVDEMHIPMGAFLKFQPLGKDQALIGEVIMAGQSMGKRVVAIREINPDGSPAENKMIHYLTSGELKDNEVYIFVQH